MTTSSTTGGNTLAELIKEFLEKVAPTHDPSAGPKPADDIWEGLITFEKGIFKLNKEEVKAGWAALQVVKEMLSKDFATNEAKLRFIARLEWRILEKMWFLSDGFEVSLGTGLREEFARWTGKHEFFAGTVMPDITYYLSTNGGGNGSGSSSQQRKTVVQELPEKAEARIIAAIEKFERSFDGLPGRVTENVRKVAQPLGDFWKFLIAMTCALSLFTTYVSYTSKNVPEQVESIQGKVKIVQDTLDYGLPKIRKPVNYSREEIHSLQDSVNKLMPRPKVKK